MKRSGRKSNKKSNRKSLKKSYTFKRSRVPPRRATIMRGGSSVLFPSSFSNSDVVASPQSYLPYNDYSNDPGFSVINSRNTGPFLTGTMSGGKRRTGKKNRGRKLNKYQGGGGDISSGISNGLNNLTNGVGVMSSPSFNETTAVAEVMSGFSNSGSAYSSAPAPIAPMA